MSAARSRRANDKHNHLQRTPILVMGCSLLIACCIAFGGTNWTASAQPSEDQLPEQNAIVEPGYYQETIGSYEAISQSDDDERAENLRLAAEAINGYVIEPGATFSFNEVVGDTTAERGYKEAPVLYSSGLGSSDGGGICQVSTALYIAAVKADLEIVERHPHSVPSDYAPIGLDATIVYGSRDLRIKNNTDFPITIYAKAVGQTVSVNLLGKPRDDGITIDATSRVVDRYEVDDAHDAHQDICHIPRQIEAAQTAREDDRQARNPKPEEQHLTIAEDELQIGLRIKVIADQAGVSEQEHRRGDEGDPHIARKMIDRHLDERHAIQSSCRLGILNHEHQHDHGRTRADEERIDIDRKRLHQALLRGMRDRCCCCSVRS